MQIYADECKSMQLCRLPPTVLVSWWDSHSPPLVPPSVCRLLLAQASLPLPPSSREVPLSAAPNPDSGRTRKLRHEVGKGGDVIPDGE